ncbi:MAG: hypothetical protein HOE02_08405 [Candidatus Marinimicrobia bacterium]|nr:hypothetical protein [Candidatus Neomarinimicrobiota bacterium]
MKLIKYILPFLVLISVSMADHRRFKSHRHKRHNKQGLTMHWRWNHGWHNCGNKKNVVIVKTQQNEKDNQRSVLDIIKKIEKLAELKEKGYITEKEYEKKKKELLNQI